MVGSETYIDAFKAHLTDNRQASGNTVSSYIRDITQFLNFCEKEDIADIAGDDIRRYLSWLGDKGRAPATTARAVASLKAFFGHFMNNAVIAANPAEGIATSGFSRELPQILTGAEIARLLEQPNASSLKGLRDKAMLETLYATGIRVSELIALDVTDVNLATNLITCRSSRERTIPVYRDAVSTLGEYIHSTRPQMLASDNESALFVNKDGGRMTRQGFWKIVKSYTEKAKITKAITPQTLRHSFAAHLLENGADIKVLQEMLGHTNVASTQIYARVVKKQLKDEYFRSHPKSIRNSR
ncbi:MAG: tyrosine recombinase [Oscillospiraceae bacterium]|nr:tyrosine recombinase [Oscillospiraceae bacterium]